MFDLTGSLSVFRIPKPHVHCQLDNYDWGRHDPVLRQIIEGFLQAWEQRENPSRLLLLGPPGIGKTHLAVGIYRWAAMRSDLTEAVYLHIPSFVKNLKKSFDTDDDPWDELNYSRMLILDDMWAAKLSDYDSSVIIPRLIETAYQSGSFIVLTSNLSDKAISQKLDPHEYSRLFENATTVNMQGPDWRIDAD